MTDGDRYNLLSCLVRIADKSDCPYPTRLKSLVKFLAKSLQLPSVTVYLLDGKSLCLSNRISTASPGTLSTCMIPLGIGGAGLCAASGKQLYHNTENLHVDEPRTGTESRFLFLPVLEKEMVTGIIAFGLTRDNPLSKKDLALLDDIPIVVAGIIQGIRLSSVSNRTVRNLTVLSELGQLLNRFIPPEEHIPLLLQACSKLSVSCCTTIRLTGNGGLPAGLFKSCRHKVRPYLQDLLQIEKSCSEQVLSSDIPHLVGVLSSDAKLPTSYVCVPLHFETTLLGTMTFFSKRDDDGHCITFDEDDRTLFESTALLISNALAGAANFQQLSKLSADNDKKIKELSLLYRVSNTILSTIKLNKLIHLILSALTSGANPFFDRAMLFLINERSGVMQGMLGVTKETSKGLITPFAEVEDILASRWDISENDMVRQRESEFSRHVMASRLELDKSLNVASAAVLEKRLIFVAKAAREKHVDRDFIRRFEITSFAVAPLIARERVVGVIIVDNTLQGNPITQDDLRFLQLFANQAGMAVENSILYNRVEDTNRDLCEAQERLIQGERLATIGEMAAGIAHELKGPLVAIGGFARRLAQKLPPPSAERECADLIVTEVLRLEKMLTDILSFSKKTAICYTPCNINEIINDALAVVQLSLKEMNIKVQKNLPRNIETFLGDCQQLKQVFINLFLNAEEAMKNGGNLNIRVATSVLDGSKAVSIKIADTGGGIPLEVLNNIFNPFYTTKDTGTGLGLPIINRIITNHGGKIHVNNKPGSGVEFMVILPLHV